MKAILRNYRHSPRKVRQVANLVRGKTVANALAELSMLPKKAALPIEKLIKSAAASAKENFKTSASDIDLLVIKEVMVDDAVTLKRSQPAARGSAHPIRKRASHVFIRLAPSTERAKKTGRNVRKLEKVVAPFFGPPSHKATDGHGEATAGKAEKVVTSEKPEKTIAKNQK